MRRSTQLIPIVLEVILMLTLFGCGQPTYKLDFDGYGFKSQKTEYAAGEKVTVYYGMPATDTDYRFWLDDDSVEMTQDYDDKHGYVFTFTMPDHAVSLHYDSHNSMEAHAEIVITFVNEAEEADVWILPHTEENLKTTLWGTATVGKLGAGETALVRLTESNDAQAWLIRIIDRDHAYYSAQDLKLEDGFRIVFRSADSKYEAVIEVLDQNGTVVARAEAFTGMLGAG